VRQIFSTIVLVVTLLLTTSSYAISQEISYEEMIDKADLIIIGKLEGKLGQRLIDLKEQDPEHPTNKRAYTDWKISVISYLKGDTEGGDIVVSTPGVKEDSDITLSSDYSFDEIIKEYKTGSGIDEDISEILLLLEQGEESFHPISPKAIVPLVEGKLYIPAELESSDPEDGTQSELEILNTLLEYTPRYSPDGELVYAGKMHWIYYYAGAFLLFITILNIWLYTKNRRSKR
jgi:hypothetical protein